MGFLDPTDYWGVPYEGCTSTRSHENMRYMLVSLKENGLDKMGFLDPTDYWGVPYEGCTSTRSHENMRYMIVSLKESWCLSSLIWDISIIGGVNQREFCPFYQGFPKYFASFSIRFKEGKRRKLYDRDWTPHFLELFISTFWCWKQNYLKHCLR